MLFKKEGFVEGVFIGALIVFLSRVMLFEPITLENLKQDVIECIEIADSEFPEDRIRECVQEEFSHIL